MIHIRLGEPIFLQHTLLIIHIITSSRSKQERTLLFILLYGNCVILCPKPDLSSRRLGDKVFIKFLTFSVMLPVYRYTRQLKRQVTLFRIALAPCLKKHRLRVSVCFKRRGRRCRTSRGDYTRPDGDVVAGAKRRAN